MIPLIYKRIIKKNDCKNIYWHTASKNYLNDRELSAFSKEYQLYCQMDESTESSSQKIEHCLLEDANQRFRKSSNITPSRRAIIFQFCPFCLRFLTTWRWKVFLQIILNILQKYDSKQPIPAIE